MPITPAAVSAALGLPQQQAAAAAAVAAQRSLLTNGGANFMTQQAKMSNLAG